jgi:radical SAM family uncharacterized protein
MNSKDRNILYEIDNPQVYTGQEINVIKKKLLPSFLNICLIFPDTYEIGMSHFGLKILYHLLNQHPEVNAERCFLPTTDSIRIFRERGVSLFSIENNIPLKQFDLLSFSLLSEMSYTNIMQVLELANIPLKSQDRTLSDPLLAAGGISSCNPEPLREYIDFFGFGDGEALFPDIIDVFFKSKNNNLSRTDILKELDLITGIYVPSLYPVRKEGLFWIPDMGDKRIKKRIFKSIDTSFPDEHIIVPISKVIFNRLDVEIARGCPQTCRFCQAKSYYAPYRTKSVDKNIECIEKSLRGTGFESFSLSSLSSGDYPDIRNLLEEIPEIIPPCTSISISSLRPSTLSDQLLSTISRFRRTGITIVPEAGTPRLRQVINKDVSNEQIYRAIDAALKYNWKQLKLYFMTGLPTETHEDIRAIIELIEGILDYTKQQRKKIKIHVSISSFVPKPHTVFQWAERESLNSLLAKIEMLKTGLKKYRNLQYDFHSPGRGVVETILSRGDCRVGDLIYQAYKSGEIFSAWDSHFHFSAWEPLIKSLKLEEFLPEINPEQAMPWDHIQINYKKEHLLEEYRKSKSGQTSPNCHTQQCRTCNGCFFPAKNSHSAGAKTSPVPPRKTLNNQVREFTRTRIFYKKDGDFRFFSHLSMMKYLERLLRKAGIPFQCTEGFHPRIKAGFLPPLPVYARGLDEVMELFVSTQLNEKQILNELKEVANNFVFNRAIFCPNRKSLMKDIYSMEYEIGLNRRKPEFERIKNHLLDSDSFSFSDDWLNLTIDYTQQGQERFSKIYKIIDPERSYTCHLTRKRIVFKND